MTSDVFTSDILRHVFENEKSSSPTEGASKVSRKPVTLHTLETHLTSCLDEVKDKQRKYNRQTEDWNIGKLGPAEICFDTLSSVGTLIVEPDRLGVTSHSTFSSIKANTCVFKGKWMYELMMLSKGVMQIGWCSTSCKFSDQEGIGDTRDSYAYDGSRLRKWNISTKKYGEPWSAGDVISCAIDCDDGTITFFRNGVSLGEAFNQVRIGSGYAYFPAVSMSPGESVLVNFGTMPLKYPLEGYKPLQCPKMVEVEQAQLLFSYLHNLLPKMIDCERGTAMGSLSVVRDKLSNCPPLTEQRSNEVTLNLIAGHIFHRLAPLMRMSFVVDRCLVQFMLEVCDHTRWRDEQRCITKLLDLTWMFLQPQETKDCLEHLSVSLLHGFCFHPFQPNFEFSKKYLSLTLAILRHQSTRRHLLSSLLFERMKFPTFMQIKTPDDPNLARLIPNVWWDGNLRKNGDSESVREVPETDKEKGNRVKFQQHCTDLQNEISEMEQIQVELLKSVLTHKDCIDGKTSRELFMEKFKSFLKEILNPIRGPMTQASSLTIQLSFFHHLVQAVRFYWDEFAANDGNFSPSKEAYTPIQSFWVDARDFLEFLCCGGLMSHLNRQLGPEVNKAYGFELQEDGKVVKRHTKEEKSSEGYPKLEMPSGNSLLELLDALVLFYHVSAHKQLGKICALRESMQEYISNLSDTDTKLSKCPHHLHVVRENLEHAKSVFELQIQEQARQMVWISTLMYSPIKQADIVWLLSTVLKTVEKASEYKKLFQYVPEFYMETVVNCFNALRFYLHPTTLFSSIPDLGAILNKYASFLVTHAFSPLLVSSDLKDTLVQALAGFTCFPDTLRVLEELPMDKRIFMIQSLIAPYENRSWAHTNWILVRIWKGCGFGYRYTHLPGIIPPKTQPTEFSYVSLQKPCPSRVFQSLLAKILLDDEARSTKFLDSLLNQLNWSFSEFVGICQEISSLVVRTESPLYLEIRQIKICSACFEISVCLLRVLEMVATVAPQVFTDWARPSAELFLKRLMQLVCHIMTRITVKDGAFQNLVAIPIQGLDSVNYYPILSVTVGIMAQLIIRCGGSSQDKATRALLQDTGFNTDSLQFVLGPELANVACKSESKQENKSEKFFSFRTLKEISNEEVEDVEKLIQFLQTQHISLALEKETVQDEDLCTICYANPQQVTFVPCGHQSCRTCITQQILSKKECFFCITAITGLKDAKGRPVLREHFHPTSASKKAAHHQSSGTNV